MNIELLKQVVASLLTDVEFSGEVLPEVSEIKQALEPLITHYQSILNYLPENVYWFDQNCKGMGCNQNVLDMLGLKSVREFKGTTFEEQAVMGEWLPETTRSFKQDTLDVLRTGKAKINVEEPPIPHPDGRTMYFLSSRVPLFDKEKNITGVVGISTDITELKKTQQMLEAAKELAEAANTAKTNFLQNMSHELRTPLNGILGMAEILSYSSRLDAKERENIANILSSGKVLLQLINNVLNFSKMEGAKIELNISEINFSGLVQEVVNSLLPVATEKRITLESYYSEHCPAVIMTDPLCVRQILSNLIDNAIKFTNQGYVRVFVDCVATSKEMILLQFSVMDTGLGIPKDQLQSIFEKFHQVNPGYVTTNMGVGLGLAIVKKLVMDLGGGIEVNSELGQGSTFSVKLPCKIKNSDPVRQEEKPSQSFENIVQMQSEKNKKPYHILLIEDSPINQKVMNYMLSLLLDCTITIAGTGAEAISLFNRDIDLVLLDIGLPDISGFDVAEALNKKMAAENFSVPLVSITAHADVNEGHPLYQQLKFSGSLIKPVQIQTLKELLHKILDQSK